MGNKLGGELAVAAQEGAKLKCVVVLADRQYAVTIQRIFDRLKIWEKITMFCILFWEVLTMTFFKLKDYIKKTEADEGFIQDEIKKFGKYLPSLADVIINERDEYIAQSLCEIARCSSKQFFIPQRDGKKSDDFTSDSRRRILAVIGAGHLQGLQKFLSSGGVSESRINEIAKSSKNPSTTWPGRGQLIIVNNEAMFPVQTSNIVNIAITP
jgi:pheromone shutdown protein TraB